MSQISSPGAQASAPITPRRGATVLDAAQPDRVLTTRVGLHIPEQLSYEGWQIAGEHLARVTGSVAWCLGDWLVYGQRRYPDRYQRVVAAAGLDYQTLRNYAWVARRVELSRRRAELSFQHHAEVASLPAEEQDWWLRRAESHGWSRNQLRQAVRESRQGNAPDRAAKPVLPRMQLPQRSLERWQRAAERARTDLRQWVVAALDQAAEDALSGVDHADEAAEAG